MVKSLLQLIFLILLRFSPFATNNGGGDAGGDAGDDADDGDAGDDQEDQDDQDDADDGDDADLTPEQLKAQRQDLRAALKKAKRDASRNRRRVAEYEQKEQAAADAEKTVLQKAEEKAEKLQAALDARDARIKQQAIRHAVELAASAMNFTDPSDVHGLADFGEVEYDDETGKVSGVEQVLKALAKAKPYLLKKSEKPNLNGDEGGDDKKPNDETLKTRFGIR